MIQRDDIPVFGDLQPEALDQMARCAEHRPRRRLPGAGPRRRPGPAGGGDAVRIWRLCIARSSGRPWLWLVTRCLGMGADGEPEGSGCYIVYAGPLIFEWLRGDCWARRNEPDELDELDDDATWTDSTAVNVVVEWEDAP